MVQVSLDNGSTWHNASTQPTVGGTTFSDSVTLSGSSTLQIRVADGAGNASTAYTHAYTYSAAPPSETVATAALSADTGASSTDFITDVAAQTISGTLSAGLASGDVVQVSLDNGSTWHSASTQPTVGDTIFSDSVTLSGSDTLQIRVMDVAGNVSTAYTHAYSLNTVAPTIVSFATSGTGIASGSGDLNAGNVVTITLTGNAALYATGTPALTLNDGGTATYAGGNGTTALTFSYTVASEENTSDLTVTGYTGTIADIAGNALSTTNLAAVGNPTGTLQIDTTAPDAPTFSSVTTITGDDSGATDTVVSGSAEAGSTVTLYQDGAPVGAAIAAGDGSWAIHDTNTLTYSTSYDFTATATDLADNTSSLSSTNTYTPDSGAACFKEGVLIRTEGGNRAVEAVMAGDKVVVIRDGQEVLEPVLWVGVTAIDLSKHARVEEAAPIRIRAGALAEGQPARDLFLSPEHCLIIEGRCVSAKLLVNGGSIVSERDHARFTYYHIELQSHGILLAENAPAESYLDTGNRSLFDNSGEPQQLHPAFVLNGASERWLKDACAPLADMKEVEAIWTALASRSETIGFPIPVVTTVSDADIHLVVDGAVIKPISDRNSRYVFVVRAGVASVTLASRFCIPSDKMTPSNRDTRRLGVAVRWIAIRSGEDETVLSADNPALQDGWHAAERETKSIFRWTNGAAMIPWENIAGPATLTVCCSQVDHYPFYDDKACLVA